MTRNAVLFFAVLMITGCASNCELRSHIETSREWYSDSNPWAEEDAYQMNRPIGELDSDTRIRDESWIANVEKIGSVIKIHPRDGCIGEIGDASFRVRAYGAQGEDLGLLPSIDRTVFVLKPGQIVGSVRVFSILRSTWDHDRVEAYQAGDLAMTRFVRDTRSEKFTARSDESERLSNEFFASK